MSGQEAVVLNPTANWRGLAILPNKLTTRYITINSKCDWYVNSNSSVLFFK